MPSNVKKLLCILTLSIVVEPETLAGTGPDNLLALKIKVSKKGEMVEGIFPVSRLLNKLSVFNLRLDISGGRLPLN